MTINDVARILLRAADIAEKDIDEEYTPEEFAAYRLLRWLSDGANEIAAEDEDAARDRMTGHR